MQTPWSLDGSRDSALTLTVRLSLTLLVWPCPWCSKNHQDLATANPVNVMFHHVSFVKSLSHSQLSPAKALLSSVNTLPLVSYKRSAEFLLQRFRRLISAPCSWRYAHWWASGDSGAELLFLLKITWSLLHPPEFPWSTHKIRILKSKHQCVGLGGFSSFGFQFLPLDTQNSIH